MKSSSVKEKALNARKASHDLAQLARHIKDKALLSAAKEILLHRNEILEANEKDVRLGRSLLKRAKITNPLLDRLKLNQTKILEISKMVESVAKLEDPVGRIVFSQKLDDGLRLFKMTVPFGVIASVFESRPEALVQITSLCIKSGNAVILKGGSEAQESNRCLHRVMNEAFVKEGLPPECAQLIEGRAAVNELLKLDDLVDLVIPRGSNEFVKYIQKSTNIPVLGHSAGICHIYVDGKADPEKAMEICYDARVQYPAVCNSMKVMLVDAKIADELLPKLAIKLEKGGVRIKGCEKSRKILNAHHIPVEPSVKTDWSTEYLDLTLPVKVVEGVAEAIDHINKYGSKHTDSIITEDMKIATQFLRMVDSASVIHNASTRFSDGYRYGLGAEVGISTNKIHARGPVGLEGLVTTKYYLFGTGQRISDYLGENARPFLHQKMDAKELRLPFSD